MANENTKGRTTIDVTPTWKATMAAYSMVLTQGDAVGRTMVREELLHIGEWLDTYKMMDWELILDAAAESDDENVQAAVAKVREFFSSDEEEEEEDIMPLISSTDSRRDDDEVQS